MCEFCKNEKPIISKVSRTKSEIQKSMAYIRKNKLVLFCGKGEYMLDMVFDETEIEYCPMCGRKLSED